MDNGVKPRGGPPTAHSDGPRAVFLAGGTLLGFVVGGVLMWFGASRWQASGMGLMVLGVAWWIGSIRPDPSTLAQDERARRQRHRSVGIALGLGALVLIFYAATMIRLGPNALRKEGFPGAATSGKNVIIEDKGSTTGGCKQVGTC